MPPHSAYSSHHSGTDNAVAAMTPWQNRASSSWSLPWYGPLIDLGSLILCGALGRHGPLPCSGALPSFGPLCSHGARDRNGPLLQPPSPTPCSTAGFSSKNQKLPTRSQSSPSGAARGGRRANRGYPPLARGPSHLPRGAALQPAARRPSWPASAVRFVAWFVGTAPLLVIGRAFLRHDRVGWQQSGA